MVEQKTGLLMGCSLFLLVAFGLVGCAGDLGSQGLGVPWAATAERGDQDLRPATGQLDQDTLRDGGVGPELVFIRGGRFLMGSPRGEERRLDKETFQKEPD